MNQEDRALLDQFADSALMNLMECPYNDFQQLAEAAYDIANAMMEARERKLQQIGLTEIMHQPKVWGGLVQDDVTMRGPESDPFGSLVIDPSLVIGPYGKRPEGSGVHGSYGADEGCCGMNCDECDAADESFLGMLETLGGRVITLNGAQEVGAFLEGLDQCEDHEDLQELLRRTAKEQQH